MREYTTQMDAARKGIITKEMEAAAKKGADSARKAEGSDCRGKGNYPLQQAAYKYCSQCHWFYAEDKN